LLPPSRAEVAFIKLEHAGLTRHLLESILSYQQPKLFETELHGAAIYAG